MDIFLDLFARWMKSRSVHLQNDIDIVVEELRALDPQFHFDWKEVWRGEGGNWDDQRESA